LILRKQNRRRKMPIPKPKPDEAEKYFISRCMDNPIMKKEFPDNKQRIAVCYSSWRGEKKMSKEDITTIGEEEKEDILDELDQLSRNKAKEKEDSERFKEIMAGEGRQRD